jgi:PadR family transcriptional regulator, regulatory protein PadR
VFYEEESCNIFFQKTLLSKIIQQYFKKHFMDIQNTQSQMRKGVLEFCILSIIQQGEVYPSDIAERMKTANLNILEGTLYPLLTRLKNAGLLSYRWVESVSGPPRKYFSMTTEGLEFYGELERTWKELADAVHALTQPVNEPTTNLNQENN